MFSLHTGGLDLESAMERQRGWHEQGRTAVMALEPLASKQEAEQQARPGLSAAGLGRLGIPLCNQDLHGSFIVTDVCRGSLIVLMPALWLYRPRQRKEQEGH